MLILEEAGGVITDLEGLSIDYIAAGLDRTVPLLACANERMRHEALSLLSATRS